MPTVQADQGKVFVLGVHRDPDATRTKYLDDRHDLQVGRLFRCLSGVRTDVGHRDHAPASSLFPIKSRRVGPMKSADLSFAIQVDEHRLPAWSPTFDDRLNLSTQSSTNHSTWFSGIEASVSKFCTHNQVVNSTGVVGEVRSLYVCRVYFRHSVAAYESTGHGVTADREHTVLTSV